MAARLKSGLFGYLHEAVDLSDVAAFDGPELMAYEGAVMHFELRRDRGDALSIDVLHLGEGVVDFTVRSERVIWDLELEGERYMEWLDEEHDDVVDSPPFMNLAPGLEARQEAEAKAAAEQAAAPFADPIEQLERLVRLRDAGALTAAEFDEQKRRILGDGGTSEFAR